MSVQLSENVKYDPPEVTLVDNPAVTTTIGPVRVDSKGLVCWSLLANSPGHFRLEFLRDGQTYEKELVVGNGYMRTSLQRPPHHWTAVLLHPSEKPLAENSPVQAIEVAYPERQSWTAGTNSWVVYWFAVSLCTAFLAKPLLKVHI